VRVCADKIDGGAAFACATGAADAMGVIHCGAWEVKIHDSWQLYNVEAASGDIGRQQDLHFRTP